MTNRRFTLCAFALSLSLLTGCGSGSRSSVEGTVTFEGAPVDGGSISFIPEGGTTGATPAGTEIKAGKYTIDSTRGPMPGKYKVEIIWKKSTGKTVANKSNPGTTVDETKQVIPNKYNSKTELTIEIKSGSNKDVNFDLKAGGPVDSGTSAGKISKAAGD